MIEGAIGGRYRVVEVVGAGAFATVYRAVDERLEAEVAVKVLAENRCLDAEVRERFVNEARRLRQAGGPGVVGVHDLGETERAQPYIVMDFADRGDLARRVAEHRRAGRPVVPDDLLTVAAALERALSALHTRRVVHRDLTPKNLLLRSDGAPASPASPAGPWTRVVGPDEHVLVGDLGLSKDLAVASGITASMGTAGFAAPEQRRGVGIDERTDLYAASAVLVWLATGHPPADDGSWPEAALAGWPPGLAPALSRGLAVDPVRRPADAATWYATVAAALEPPTVAPTAPLDPPPGDVAAPGGGHHPPSPGAPAAARLSGPGGDPAAPRPRRRLLLAGLAAVLVALVAGGVGWAVGRSGGDGTATETASVDGGRVRATAGTGDLATSIEGPEVVVVGEVGIYEVDPGPGATSWTWVGPDGRFGPDAPTLEVTPSTTGTLLVTLVAGDDAGRTVRVVLRARAEEP